jgi:hypothetical protein
MTGERPGGGDERQRTQLVTAGIVALGRHCGRDSNRSEDCIVTKMNDTLLARLKEAKLCLFGLIGGGRN